MKKRGIKGEESPKNGDLELGENIRKKRMRTMQYLVYYSHLTCKRLILGSTRGELFFLSYNYINLFCHSRLFGLLT